MQFYPSCVCKHVMGRQGCEMSSGGYSPEEEGRHHYFESFAFANCGPRTVENIPDHFKRTDGIGEAVLNRCEGEAPFEDASEARRTMIRALLPAAAVDVDD